MYKNMKNIIHTTIMLIISCYEQMWHEYVYAKLCLNTYLSNKKDSGWI